ncbi:hypothetical protein [Methanobacterium sp.]|uniref:hypothetical protein n=1 Tax=Methanobacterium sp. TaxID=2164 RepID=UPI002AB80F4A|nr:hypothetical protein [Methanobacterium sp.]MDY9922785.1 hypothetical protein [Methanobacterium sp.]
MTVDLLNKEFEFTMPLVKSYDGDDGYYHIKFAISSADPDLQGDQMTDKALNEIVEQAKGINIDGSQLKGINIDDNHQKGLKSLIGPVTDAWIDTEKRVWVDLRVREEWETTIKDLVNSKTHLGGSIQGKATEVLPDTENGIRKINGVLIIKAALTDIPAAWDTRGTAQAVSKCYGSMCAQIMKSLGIETLEVKNVTRNESDSYESLRDKVRTAINDKFTVGDRSEFWVRQTWPDAVIVENYDEDKLYEITYSINEAGEVELGEPVEVEMEYVEKTTAFYDMMLKDIQNKPNGGGNLTKVDETIPEGMDEKFVDKVKSLGEDGKKFLKGILGVEDVKDPEGDPGGNPNPSTGGAQVNKSMISEDDLKKALDERDAKFEKTLKEKDDKIESLEKTVGKREDTISKQEHDDLVSKALKKTQDLGIEEVKTEEDLMKHLQEKEDFTEEELKEDPDACIKTAIRIWKGASKYIPAGKLPRTDENEMKKMADKHAENAAEIRKNLAERGTK